MKADAELKIDVEAELAWDPSVASPHVTVDVRDGVVTLGGRVASLAEKHAVVEAARRISGVRALAVELAVVLPGHEKRTDVDIAAAARQALDWSTFVPRDQVLAIVEGGRITLHGEVDRQYQRAAAERAVRGLRGVTAVNNLIRLASPINVPGIEHRIAAALERQAAAGTAPMLTVRVDGTTVRLHGRVRSWAERDAAAEAAWSAPGVGAVVNDVVVA